MSDQQSANTERKTIFIGLSGVAIGDQPFHLPRGMVLEKTFAHLMSPMMMSFGPRTEAGHHPAPWKAVQDGKGADITTQLIVPPSSVADESEYEKIAATLMLLIRVWCDPSASMIASSLHSFNALPHVPDREVQIMPVETLQKYFPLAIHSQVSMEERLIWVRDHFEQCHRLMFGKPEFQLAASALNAGQFIPNSALTLISLMGALEAIFSPSKTELKFRVSSLIAAYLHPYGKDRLTTQKQIGLLYDKRSAAAHGKPNHAEDDVLKAFELLRAVLIRMIEDGKVPSKDELERNLFGSS